ncbi:aminopeptidase [Treponema phagedenis]|uniref:Aminopeptidase n=1 Tax=Treponema phagedenis TaxID=162 RepID=A0A0B7GV72_TREPH|nr:aminopeptidase [Treponema phagedenis]EFW38182.1 aminopeptidase II [Treponema phagedenis F0421]NVP24675.1 aminopeptidase [Treponema phagedenis]QEJ95694.1 aminopeptidase [Treponema phagedenis]QEJ97576.1 aminopeptidase [Treponema phagedenis]QEK00542.1 aminopeptidase [Treponema phagedenis]
MDKTNIEKYVELILKVGLNIQKGDNLLVLVSEHTLGMVREVTRQAYKLGARDVIYDFSDDEMTLARYNFASDEAFKQLPQFKVEFLREAYKANYHRLALIAPNPELLKTVDPRKVSQWQLVYATAMKPVMKYTMENHVKWTVAAHPSPAWALSVFPELGEEAAIEKLWQKIFEATRVTCDDPIKAWQEHNEQLKRHQKFLTEMNFEKLLYRAPGTELEVYLTEGHRWMGGSAQTLSGVEFTPNIPTEEVFSMPHAYKVNGTLKSTKPLAVRGQIVDGFHFTFKDGKVIDFDAAQGKDVLRDLLNTDEGARRLGEVALVGDNSPISNTKILFKNTLFDENASCHFAIGNAYSENIADGANLSDERKKEVGMNNSVIHVDFMVGGPELSVIGVKKDGTEIPILQKGNWVI